MLLMQSEENRVEGNGAEVLLCTWVSRDRYERVCTPWRGDEEKTMKKLANLPVSLLNSVSIICRLFTLCHFLV